MTAGGSSIPEVQRLLAVLATGRRCAEPVRELLFGHPELVAVEILTTADTAAIVAAKQA